MRVDLYSAAGAKLDVPPITGEALLHAEYVNRINRLGDFSLQVAADSPVAQNVTAGRRAYLYGNEGLEFIGVIRTREIQVNADGRAILNVSGVSLGDQLNGLTTGRGLTFDGDSLATAVSTLTAGTDFEGGEIGNINVPARRFDGVTRMNALASLAAGLNLTLREDHLQDPPVVDLASLGDSSGIVLRNVALMTPELADNPYLRAIQSLKVKAQSLDLVNRVIPYGQIEGLFGLQFNLKYLSPDAPVATHLYLPSSGTAPISPAYDPDWTNTAQAVRRPASIARSSTADLGVNVVGNGGNSKNLQAQFIYGPIAAQTIAGNVTGQVRVFEQNAADNVQFRLNIRVVSSDGSTVRGTLLAGTTLGTEFDSAANTNRTIPSTALSSVDSQEGDYVLIELGCFQATAVVHTHGFFFGDTADDLPVDETTTTALAPWIEFSQWIAPIVDVDTLPEYPVLSDANPDGSDRFYIQDDDSIAQFGVREREFFYKDVLPLGQLVTDFTSAARTLYGLAVTTLTRKLEEQVVYEVEAINLKPVIAGVRQYNVGDTLKVEFEGVTTEGTWLSVNRDLYLLEYARSFDPSGMEQTRVSVGTFLREAPSDDGQIRQMTKDLGIEQSAPLGIFRLPDGGELQIGDGGVIRADGGSYWDAAVLVLATDSVTGDSLLIQVSGESRVQLTADLNAALLACANYSGREATLKLTGGYANLGFETLGSTPLGVSYFRVYEDGISLRTDSSAPTFGGGNGVFFILNAGVDPTTNPTAGGILYASAGRGRWRGSSGTVTTFGPADPHCPTCGRDFAMEWENEKYGHLSLCLWCLTENAPKGIISRHEKELSAETREKLGRVQ